MVSVGLQPRNVKTLVLGGWGLLAIAEQVMIAPGSLCSVESGIRECLLAPSVPGLSAEDALVLDACTICLIWRQVLTVPGSYEV